MEKPTLRDRLESLNEQLNLAHHWIVFLKFKRLIFFLPIFVGLLGYLIALNIKGNLKGNLKVIRNVI